MLLATTETLSSKLDEWEFDESLSQKQNNHCPKRLNKNGPFVSQDKTIAE